MQEERASNPTVGWTLEASPKICSICTVVLLVHMIMMMMMMIMTLMAFMALLMLMCVGFTSALYIYPGTHIDLNRDDDDDDIDGGVKGPLALFQKFIRFGSGILPLLKCHQH